jgi:hypothetical protein
MPFILFYISISCPLSCFISVYHALYLVLFQYIMPFILFYFSISCPLSCFISVYHALYLDTFTSQELIGKLAKLYSVASQQIAELYCSGPSGIYILTTNEVIHVVILWKYTNSLRHSITNHCDRCITHLDDDMDIISFVLFHTDIY